MNEEACKIQREILTEALFDEIMPLGQKCWDECSEIKGETCSFHGERGFKIQPDIPQYLLLEANGGLLAMTLRDESGTLKGFSLSVLYRSLHHAPVPCANVDTFYIEPEYRACIRRMVSMMEQEFTDRGVVVIGWPISPGGKMFPILKLLGYAPDDVVMERRLCALQPQ